MALIDLILIVAGLCVDHCRRKLVNRVREIEDILTDLQGRVPGLEKAKARLTAENSELTDELERVMH